MPMCASVCSCCVHSTYAEYYSLNTDSMPPPPSCSQKAHRHLLLLLTLFLATFLKGSKVPAEDTAVTSLE